MSNEKISSITTSDGRVPNLVYDNGRIKVRFIGNLSKQDKVKHNHGLIVKIYIVYRLTPATKDSSVTLQNCYLVLLNQQKMLILTSTNILDMVLDLIQEDAFHIQMEDMAEILLFLELI